MRAPFTAVAILAGCTLWVSPAPAAEVDFHDAHFHIANYERLFDAANRKVRDWERRQNGGESGQ